VRREKEFEVFRDQMKEKREKGTTKMTEDPAAAARKEDARAAVWADMSKQERKAALENVKISKEQLAEANKTTGAGSAKVKSKAAAEYQKVKDIVPRFAHGGSLAVTRGEVVGGKRGRDD